MYGTIATAENSIGNYLKTYFFHDFPQRVKIKTQTLNIYIFWNLQIREDIEFILKIIAEKLQF